MTLNFDKVLRIKISDNKDTTFWCLLDIIFKWHKIYQNVHQVILPFKNQKLANAVKKQLSEQCNKLGHSIQPVGQQNLWKPQDAWTWNALDKATMCSGYK